MRLTDQQYFEQRILNHDKRFANTAAYVFAAFAFIEKKQLDRNINISFMRGKKKLSNTGNSVYSLDDPYSVLDNSPGTPRYWQKKKYELIARLENLGPFTFFFTLSCADKRWNENFTSLLKDYKVKYLVKNGLEECFVDGFPLNEFLLKHESKHEFIRKNILSATLNFNHRVQEFIKNIIMNEKGEMCAEYYNYRVEFQLRGAAHIHGTIWIDWDRLEEEMEKRKKDVDDSSDEEDNSMKKGSGGKPILDVGNIKKAFSNIKDEVLGSADNDPNNKIQCKALAQYIDRFVSCSLKDPSTVHLVRSVNMHNHTKPCFKYCPTCRFRFPRFPCLKTIISIPSEVKYKDPHMASSELKKSQALLLKVKKILEDEKEMIRLTELHQDKIDIYMKHLKVSQWIGNYFDEIRLETIDEFSSKDDFILEEYKDFFLIKSEIKHKDLDEQRLKKLMIFHENEINKFKLDTYLKERLDQVLLAAKIEGETFTDRNEKYEEALSLSSRGYAVIAKRDIDEIYVNFYNPEWIKSWNGNMDI